MIACFFVCIAFNRIEAWSPSLPLVQRKIRYRTQRHAVDVEEHEKKISKKVIAQFGLAFAAGFGSALLGVNALQNLKLPESPATRLASAQFESVLTLLENGYLEDINPQELTETGLAAMLATLDPYTEYLASETGAAAEQIEQVEGRYAGVGLGLRKANNNILVAEAFEGYAFEAGLRPGDRLLRVGDMEITEATSLSAVRDAFRAGPAGSTIDVIFRHQWEEDENKNNKVVRLERKAVRRRDLELATIFSSGDKSIAYLRLSGFSRETAGDANLALRVLDAAAKQSQENGLQGIVLDLRSNPGGLLESAVQLAAQFAPPGSTLVTAQGRGIVGVEAVNDEYAPIQINDSTLFETRARKIEQSGGLQQFDFVAAASEDIAPWRSLPLAVLIDANTASAAELVAAAIEDLDLGIIVGQPSFGKGLVQDIATLPGGASLKLTVGKYLAPSGRCLQKIQYTENKERIKAFLATEQGKANTIDELTNKIDSSEKNNFQTLITGRPVQANSGVTPDIVVSANVELSELETTLLVQGVYDRYFDKILTTSRADLAKELYERSTIAGSENTTPLPPKRLLTPADLRGLEAFALDQVANGKLSLEDGSNTEARRRLATDIRKLFATRPDRIQRLADTLLRDRFFRSSANLRLQLEDDAQLRQALNCLRDPSRYDAILGRSSS